MVLEKYEGMTPSNLLKELGLYSVPVDLEALCDKLGVEKQTNLRFSSHSGEIKVDEAGKVKIWINSKDAPNRRRFTLAHEIGHLINDIIPYLRTEEGVSEFEDDVETLKRDGRQHPIEFRANDFAARLLMPQELIMVEGNKVISRLKDETGKKKIPVDLFVNEMAKTFKVSEQAMRIRLGSLDII